MATTLVGIRIPTDARARLNRLAANESYRRGEPVATSTFARELLLAAIAERETDQVA